MTSAVKAVLIFTLLASVDARAQSWTGWHPTAWTNERLATAEDVTMCAVLNGPFSFTNYVAPFTNGPSGREGVPVESVESFYSDIEFGQPCSTSPVVNSWEFTLINPTGTQYVESRSWTGTPQSVTLKAQARDCVAIDCYLALKERYAVTTTNPNPSTAWAQKPRFYRSNRETLVSLKETASSLMLRYADNSYRTNGTFDNAFLGRVVYRWSGNQWGALVSGDIPHLSQTSMIIRQAFPGMPVNATTTSTVYGWQVGNYSAWRVTNVVYGVTNILYGFADLTPYRQLLGIGGAMPAVQTYTSIVDGVEQLSTATNYAPGFDGRDYGWQVLRRAITNMTTLITTHDWIGWDTNGVHTLYGHNSSISGDCGPDPLTDNWENDNFVGPHKPAFYAYSYHQQLFPNTECNFADSGCLWVGAGGVLSGYMRFRTVRANRYTLSAYGDWLPRSVTYYARWGSPDAAEYGGQGDWLPPSGYNTNMHAVASVSAAAYESDYTPIIQLPMPSFPPSYQVDGCVPYGFPLLGAGLYVGANDAAPATVDYDFERK
jgi:hypothetical protein